MTSLDPDLDPAGKFAVITGASAGIGAATGGPALVGGRLALPLDGSITLDEMDRTIIETALERCDGNVTATARLLGTTRETLRYRIQKYDL